MTSSGVHVPVKCKLDARLKLTNQLIDNKNCQYSLSDCNDTSTLRLEGRESCSDSAILGDHACLFSNDLEPDLYRIILTQNRDGNIFCWYIETLDKDSKDFRIIVTSNQECSRHSYGMFLKFPENIQPDFVFSFVGGEHFDQNLKGCNDAVTLTVKNITNQISPDHRTAEPFLVTPHTRSTIKHSFTEEPMGSEDAYDPDISVNAAQRVQSPSRHVKISEISGLDSLEQPLAPDYTSYGSDVDNVTLVVDQLLAIAEPTEPLDVLHQSTHPGGAVEDKGSRPEFRAHYDYDTSKAGVESSISYDDYTKPSEDSGQSGHKIVSDSIYQSLDYNSPGPTTSTSYPFVAAETTDGGRIGLVMGPQDYQALHYSTRIKLANNNNRIRDRIVPAHHTLSVPGPVSGELEPLVRYARPPSNVNQDYGENDWRASSSLARTVGTTAVADTTLDKHEWTLNRQNLPKTQSSGDEKKTWETTYPYAVDSSHNPPLGIQTMGSSFENNGDTSYPQDTFSLVTEKNFATRILESSEIADSETDSKTSVEELGFLHRDPVNGPDSVYQDIPAVVVTSGGPKAKTTENVYTEVIFHGNVDVSTRVSLLQNATRTKEDIKNFLNPVLNFPTRPAYVKHTTQSPLPDSKTIPLLDVIMAGNRDYFSPVSSATNNLHSKPSCFVILATSILIAIYTWTFCILS